MRLRLEVTEGEYARKRESMVRALVDQFRPIDPDLASALAKALPAAKPPALKFQALRDIHAVTQRAYNAMLDFMLADIATVVDRGIAKSEDDPDPDYDEETGEPIINPETGLSPSEEADDPPDDDPDEELEASRAPRRQPVARRLT